jgi:hypothetical protein
MSQFPNRRLMPFLLMILAVASLGLAACQAAMETKQGGLNEFCNNRDSDCREGLVCEAGVCVMANPAVTDACEQVCMRIDTCGVTEPNCINDCSTEIQNWGDGVIETFASCVVDDLTCEEIGDTANDAAQVCYDRLPLDTERADRCRLLVRELQSCRPGVNTDRFQSDCVYLARTAGDELWSKTDGCAESVEFGECSETVDCINQVFKYEENPF